MFRALSTSLLAVSLLLSLTGCLATGGPNPDYGSSSPRSSTCTPCRGSGRCGTCNGTGRFLGSGQTGCSTCSGSGACINCGGRGSW